MKISYSKRSDVLYIVLATTANPCTYVEIPGGIITRIDDVTERVVGITIYSFMDKVESGERLSIPELGEDLSGISLLGLYSRAS